MQSWYDNSNILHVCAVVLFVTFIFAVIFNATLSVCRKLRKKRQQKRHAPPHHVKVHTVQGSYYECETSMSPYECYYLPFGQSIVAIEIIGVDRTHCPLIDISKYNRVSGLDTKVFYCMDWLQENVTIKFDVPISLAHHSVSVVMSGKRVELHKFESKMLNESEKEKRLQRVIMNSKKDT